MVHLSLPWVWWADKETFVLCTGEGEHWTELCVLERSFCPLTRMILEAKARAALGSGGICVLWEGGWWAAGLTEAQRATSTKQG